MRDLQAVNEGTPLQVAERLPGLILLRRVAHNEDGDHSQVVLAQHRFDALADGALRVAHRDDHRDAWERRKWNARGWLNDQLLFWPAPVKHKAIISDIIDDGGNTGSNHRDHQIIEAKPRQYSK